ncbi:MAG: DUF1848 domain-containing protein [Bacteroidetes bacterium]|nr:DUF1848 domain-containing protein [Bacteroidota bacterium]
MIISASRRTDIPAFFSDWFYNNLGRGYFLVRNPMNIHQISQINISPSTVDCFVFWTKNPEPFLRRIKELNGYKYYFQYTVTGYGRSLEPNVPSMESTIQTFISLSKSIGPKRVIWRYDPILLSNKFDMEFHVSNFTNIAGKLSGHTKRCVISFVDFYKKTIRNLSGIDYDDISQYQIDALVKNLSEIARSHNIELVTCAEDIDLRRYNVNQGKCIDEKLIEEFTGFSLKIKKDANQRQECGCAASIDIGAYNTCPHSCLYCYANFDLRQVRENYEQHDEHSGLLFGSVGSKDTIRQRKMLSCKNIQQKLL